MKSFTQGGSKLVLALKSRPPRNSPESDSTGIVDELFGNVSVISRDLSGDQCHHSTTAVDYGNLADYTHISSSAAGSSGKWEHADGYAGWNDSGDWDRRNFYAGCCGHFRDFQ
ncbi:hypothetical protein FNV43_RR06839 [Rhamnella rubrinervis]|uniref:Uncharacterized protein n=1 Tax=Rhamnella rubrinervis TaxID=2594499 RepID=A0A8K0HFA9_9ROSA|nr:hypothetical protein FNV43_RR06839 [Rhamnella rubrinervis]